MEEVVTKKKYGRVGAILAVVGLTFVLLSIYLVLYAPFLTNNKYVIPVRKAFYEGVLEKVLLPEHLPYSVMVREVNVSESGEREYTYAVVGKFVNIDTESGLLTIRDMNGKMWKMDFATQVYGAPAAGPNYRNLMLVEKIIAGDNTETYETKYYLYSINEAGETEPYFRTGEIVMILWKDKRTLADISTPIPLRVVPSGERYLIPIIKIMAE